MITRSPPVRRAQPAAPPNGNDHSTPSTSEATASSSTPLASRTAALASATLHSSTSQLQSSTSRLLSSSTSSRRPEDAQHDYWVKQIHKAIVERDEARNERDEAQSRAAAAEKARLTEVQQLNSSSIASKRQSSQLLDAVQSIHNYSFLKKKVASSTLSLNHVAELDRESRQGRLMAVFRDAKILEFQNAEFWLRLEQKKLEVALQDQLEETQRITSDLVSQRDEADLKLVEVTEELSEAQKSFAELQASKSESHRIQTMLKSKESELASLISEKKALESSIEDLETALQTAEASLKATKIDLVKKKKSDERDGAELEKLRESKVDSELKIKQLEKALKEEKMNGRSRIQEADASIADLKTQLNDAKIKAAEASRAAAAASKSKASKSFISQPDNEGPPPKAKPAKKVVRKQPSPEPEPEPELSDEEEDSYVARQATPSISSDASIHDDSPPPPPQPKRPKAKSKPPPPPDSPQSQSPQRKKTTMKPKSPRQPVKKNRADSVFVISSGSEPEASAPARASSKAASKKKTSSASTSISKSQQIRNSPSPPPPSKPKPRRPIPVYGALTPNNLGREVPLSPKALGKRRAPDEGPGVNGLKRAVSAGASRTVREREEEEEEEIVEVPKKKKRIVGGGLGRTLSASQWSNTGDFDLGMGMPMMSPIARGQPPARSFSGQRR